MRFRAAMRTFFTVTMALGVLAVAARLTAQLPPEVKPGPEHELLKLSEGAWDVIMKAMGGDYKGTVACKIGLNGLWLLEQVQFDFGGMPYEGRGATSYDPAKKKYINIWIDSMSTSPMVSDGTYDKATKTMTLVGNMQMPDGKSIKATLITVHKDADTRTFALRGAGPDGKEFEMFQITYKRRAKG